MKTEIVLPAAELKSILPGLSKVVSKRSSLPVLACVRIERDSKGEITLGVTDLDDFVSARLNDPQPGEATTLLVPWEPLSKAIKGTKENVVIIPEGENGAKLRTFAGGNQIDHTLAVVDPKEWPPVPQVTKPGLLLNQDARSAIQQAFDCASDDPSRTVLNAACLDVTDGKAHYVVGTNGRMLYSANSFSFGLKESVLLPPRKFLTGFLDASDYELSIEPATKKTGGWLQFKNNRWTFITKQVEGQFPNWKQIIPSVNPAAKLKLDDAVVETLLEAIPQLPGEARKNSPLTLIVCKNELRVEASSNENDKPTVIPIHGIQSDGRDFKVGINRHYLTKALKFGLTDMSVFDSGQRKDRLPMLICESKGRRLAIALLVEDVGPSKVPQSAPAATTNVNAAPTPTPTAETQNESNSMTKATTSTATTEPQETPSAVKTVITQVENIKDTLKGVVSDLTEVLASLKTVEKEKKTTDKEIESVRSTLRTIQSVKI